MLKFCISRVNLQGSNLTQLQNNHAPIYEGRRTKQKSTQAEKLGCCKRSKFKQQTIENKMALHAVYNLELCGHARKFRR